MTPFDSEENESISTETPKLNKHAIETIARALETDALWEQVKVRFDMSSYVTTEPNTCGSSACIAGWAVSLYEEDGSPRVKPLKGRELDEIDKQNGGCGISMMAAKILGLNERDAERLFAPDNLSEIRAEDAVVTLTTLARTGEIEWDRNELQRRSCGCGPECMDCMDED